MGSPPTVRRNKDIPGVVAQPGDPSDGMNGGNLLFPKYIELKYRLERDFRKGGHRAHEALPSENFLSRKYRVSADTVRKALHELDNEGFLYRLHRRGTFISPEVKRQQVLVVIQNPKVRHPWDSWHLDLMSGLMESARDEFPSLMPILVDEHSFLASLHDLDYMYRHLLGVVVFRLAPVWSAAEKVLGEKGIPMVFIGSQVHVNQMKAAHGIFYDEAAVTRCALEHLHEAGVRDYALVMEDTRHPSLVERANCFHQWVRGKGITVPRSQIVTLPTGDRARAACFKGKPWLRALDRFQAGHMGVFCVSDAVALFVTQEAVRNGKSIPRDFSVVGVDDLAVGALTMVPLTTVRLDLYRDGQRALRILAAIASGKSGPLRETGGFQLIARQSVAKPGS